MQPYLPARPQAFLFGPLSIVPEGTLEDPHYRGAGSLVWNKSGLAADASYRAGFGPITTILSLDPWTKPTAGNLASLLGLSGTTCIAYQSKTGLPADAHVPTSLRIGAANTFSVLDPTANLTKWKTTLAIATGIFTGSFEVVDGVKKISVPFSGVLRQNSPFSDSQPTIGAGTFILPALSGAATKEVHTGKILFQQP